MILNLLYLNWHILLNEYRIKFFSKSTIIGAMIVLLLSLFAFGFGFGIVYFVNYIRLHPELNIIDPFYTAKLLFLEAVFPFIMLKLYGKRGFKQINLNKLNFFPVAKRVIFLFDINIGVLDFASFFFAIFLIGLVAGAGGFAISICITVVFILQIISLVYFVHVFGELLFSIIKLFSSLPKIRTTFALAAFFAILYFIVGKNLEWEAVLTSNPFSWNISSVFSLTIFNESHWLFNVILLNTLYSLTILILLIAIKIFHTNLFSSHILQKVSVVKKKQIKLPAISSLFPEKLQPYLEKDLKYISRSSRSISAIILEYLLIIFIVYMHYSNNKSYNTFYFPAGFVMTFPLIMWDFFLSNSWGLERRGFGFYLYSGTDFNNLLKSKNLSFIIARLPGIILISLTLSVMFSFNYIPVIILLYFILNLLSLSFSNIVSVQNPFPEYFKESPMSQKKRSNISWIGFAGLFIYLIITVAILVMLYKLGTSFIFYFVVLTILSILLFLYKKMTLFASSLLIKQKELIYKKLVKI